LGCRTIAEIQECGKAKGKKRLSVKNEPLFPWIPLTRVVVDPLHLFLRVSDQLFGHLIELVKLQDQIDHPSKKSTDKGKHVCGLESYIEECHISFRFYTTKDGKGLKAKSLRGPDYHKLHKAIDVKKVLPFKSDDYVQKFQQLWNSFYNIYNDINGEESSITDDMIRSVQGRTKSWLELFVKLFQAKDVTPYMHIFYSHVHQFLSLHGSLRKFTQQGCEKLNDILTTSYFRGSNHRGLEAIKQIFLRASRVNKLQISREN
jgi:hypothetical protein